MKKKIEKKTIFGSTLKTYYEYMQKIVYADGIHQNRNRLPIIKIYGKHNGNSMKRNHHQQPQKPQPFISLRCIDLYMRNGNFLMCRYNKFNSFRFSNVIRNDAQRFFFLTKQKPLRHKNHFKYSRYSGKKKVYLLQFIIACEYIDFFLPFSLRLICVDVECCVD